MSGEVRELVRERLIALRDPEYGEFSRKLFPDADAGRILGVRSPALRQLAKQLRKEDLAEAFLSDLPHLYLEENNLHSSLLSGEKNLPRLMEGLDRFLPCIDNWATCDTLRPVAFRKHPPELPGKIRRWLDSGETYTVRFGLGMLMSFYLDEAFSPEYPDWASGVDSEEYYVKMMVAWYFATALAKQYDAAVPYLKENRLDPWTHNKTIQKAVESFRVPEEHKAYLRTLRR